MDDRQAKILSALIKDYIRSAEPVGSKTLVERRSLPYSPATVRTELGELEASGYLSHPHTSAGRVPTSKGYRHFVDREINGRSLSKTEAMRLRSNILRLWQENEYTARSTARLLASMSQALAITGVMDREEVFEAGLSRLLREPEFTEEKSLLDISRVLEAIEDNYSELFASRRKTLRIYIGEENPYVRTREASVLVASCELPSGEYGFFALVGPIRMRYDRNIPLLEEMINLIKSRECYEQE